MSAPLEKGGIEMTSNEAVLNKILKKHPSMAGLLFWNPNNGCLEYRGKNTGRLVGNPPLFDPNRKKRNILLRKSIWLLFHGRVPKGKFVRNSCNTRLCHNPHHQFTSKERIHYQERGTSYANDLSEEEVQTIRYYKIITPIVLARVFDIPKTTVKLIWEGKGRGEVKQPKGFKPNTMLSDRVEQERQECHFDLRVEGQYLVQARNDIIKAKTRGREADILWKFLKGVSIQKLKKIYKIPKANIYLIRQQALLRIWRKLGTREWVRKASKGKVETWDKTWPKLPKTRL
jgi:DNA-binding transcriptional regulator YiaG